MFVHLVWMLIFKTVFLNNDYDTDANEIFWSSISFVLDKLT